MKFNFTLCSLLVFILSFSQNDSNQAKIKTNLEEYFHFERENIHVQFNKTLYVSDENIAFKGYVFNKQNNLANLNTTNVQLVIYDAKGQVVQKQLLYTSIGTFEGTIHLNENLVSGQYYFHFYTNWMNNFTEDESFVQPIEIINKNEPYNLKTNQPDFSTVAINFWPESGVFIKNIKNTIGIQIKDCNEFGIQINQGLVVDSKGKTITTFFTNKMGYGKFDISPESNEMYTVKIATNKLNTQKQLPQPQNSGICISYTNTNSSPTLDVSVKTNSDGVKLFQNKKYTLLIHQNGKNIQKEFNFNDKNPTQTFNFYKYDLSNGVNSIRIIDENNNEICERLVYLSTIAKEVPSLETQSITNDSIGLIGTLNSKIANLSISVLTKDNACNEQKNSILGTFYLNTYLEKPVQNNYVLFDPQNSSSTLDMELLMLNQEKSKYHWNNIMTNKPKESYTFSKGITINGAVTKTLNPKIKYKVALISLKNNIYEETILDKNNRFSFDNLIAIDSTSFQLKLIDNNNMTIETKIICNVLPNDDPFLKELSFKNNTCPAIKDFETTYTFNTPEIDKKTIPLKEINIKKQTRTNQNESNHLFSNSFQGNVIYNWKMLNHFSNYANDNGLNQGFDSTFNNPNINYSNYTRSDSQLIYIDGVPISDTRDLNSIDPKEVASFKITHIGTSNISSGGFRTINILLKKDRNTPFFAKEINTIRINNGFAKTTTFKNTVFSKSKEFNIFGTLQWSPNVFLDSNHNFEIKIPKTNQKEILVFMEGFTIDGQLISEIKKIPISSL